MMNLTHNIFSSLSCVREIWESRELCDLSLVSDDGQTFPCHKLLLSAHSPVLRRLLASPGMSSLAPVFLMFGISSAEVNNILQFFYTGQVVLQTSEVQGFMKTAEKLEMSNIAEEHEDDISISKRKRSRPSKKIYSKEGVKKVKDKFEINHVLKVEVNNDTEEVEEVEEVDSTRLSLDGTRSHEVEGLSTIGTLNEVPEPMEHSIMETKSFTESFFKSESNSLEKVSHRRNKAPLQNLQNNIIHQECELRKHLSRKHQPKQSTLI